MKFDHKKFFDSYRTASGSLKQSQVTGLEKLLTNIEQDPNVKDVRWAAYMMATVKHECADTWLPIEEYGKGKGRDYGVPVTVKDADGKEYTNTYYGRGFVQLTWKENYTKMGKALGLGDDLLIHPARTLEPDIAYRIMSYGMRKGSFTGKKLSDYINQTDCDYKSARRIINALDQWAKIKGYAEQLEAALRTSQIEP